MGRRPAHLAVENRWTRLFFSSRPLGVHHSGDVVAGWALALAGAAAAGALPGSGRGAIGQAMEGGPGTGARPGGSTLGASGAPELGLRREPRAPV